MNKNIKKLIDAIPIALCSLFAIYPVFEIIALFLNPEFHLYSKWAIAIIQVVLAVAALVASIIFKPKLGKVAGDFASAWLPVSVVNALCFIFEGLSFTWILATIWCGCILYIYIKSLKDSIPRAICASVSVILAFVVAGSLIYVTANTLINNRKVLRDVVSENGEFTAEIGTKNSLFGKKTVISVTPNEPKVGLLIGGYFSEPKVIYEGEEHIAMIAKVEWDEDNENILIINGTRYEIEF